MSKLKAPPDYVNRLKTALVQELQERGIHAEVDSEPVPPTKLHRVFVYAPEFQAMWHSERQDLVWAIAERVLSPEEVLNVSMILTLSPEECAVE